MRPNWRARAARFRVGLLALPLPFVAAGFIVTSVAIYIGDADLAIVGMIVTFLFGGAFWSNVRRERRLRAGRRLLNERAQARDSGRTGDSGTRN